MAKQRIAALLKVCQQCGKEFHAKDRRHASLFCTRGCWKASLSKWKEKSCEHCGETYIARPYMAEKQRFCGYACFYASEDERIKKRTEKPCSKCGIVKPLSDYTRAKCRKREGHGPVCRECNSEYTRQRYADNTAHIRQRKYKWRQNNIEKVRANERAKSATIRKDVLAAYGGLCVCCGESEPAFLAIDHIYNDGKEHRQQTFGGQRTGSGKRMYLWLRKQGYPKDRFQLLCHNCNMAKSLYGQCPHFANPLAAKLSVSDSSMPNLSDVASPHVDLRGL